LTFLPVMALMVWGEGWRKRLGMPHHHKET